MKSLLPPSPNNDKDFFLRFFKFVLMMPFGSETSIKRFIPNDFYVTCFVWLFHISHLSHLSIKGNTNVCNLNKDQLLLTFYYYPN